MQDREVGASTLAAIVVVCAMVLAAVLTAVGVFGVSVADAQERKTARCGLLYGNFEYENRNWDKIASELVIAGGCTTTTSTSTSTTSTTTTSTTTTT